MLGCSIADNQTHTFDKTVHGTLGVLSDRQQIVGISCVRAVYASWKQPLYGSDSTIQNTGRMPTIMIILWERRYPPRSTIQRQNVFFLSLALIVESFANWIWGSSTNKVVFVKQSLASETYQVTHCIKEFVTVWFLAILRNYKCVESGNILLYEQSSYFEESHNRLKATALTFKSNLKKAQLLIIYRIVFLIMNILNYDELYK